MSRGIWAKLGEGGGTMNRLQKSLENDHGHWFVKASASSIGFDCKNCGWYITKEESGSPFYMQNQGDCDGVHTGSDCLQQCCYGQLMIFQDGKWGLEPGDAS